VDDSIIPGMGWERDAKRLLRTETAGGRSVRIHHVSMVARECVGGHVAGSCQTDEKITESASWCKGGLFPSGAAVNARFLSTCAPGLREAHRRDATIARAG
jgi:hypothetical protein